MAANKISLLNLPRRRILIRVGIGVAIAFHLAYILFFVKIGHGPVDFDTFMDIGRRYLDGQEVYGENSFYPLPFVAIFSVFSTLPFSLSFPLWMSLQILAGLVSSGWNPWIFAFAPLASTQTAALGMVGLWGYRRNQDVSKISGGFWLALTTLKPQLGFIPCAWALWQWIHASSRDRRVPRQMWAFFGIMTIIYLPFFIRDPDWIGRWLANPRSLRERAMAGFIPRLLLYIIPPQTSVYWLILILFAILLLLFIRRRLGLDLDLMIIWGFIVSPFIHDYDLIQLIPLLETAKMRLLAVLASIPGWLVILFAYGNDHAWFAYTIIAPSILIGSIRFAHPGIAALNELKE